jgi:hypothetical protein
MSSQGNTLDAAALFGAAADQGLVSAATHQALTVVDLGAQIQAALGTPPDLIEATEQFLVAIVLDDSSSIRFAGNEPIVRTGVKEVVKALGGSKTSDGILMLIQKLNSGLLCPFTPIRDVPDITPQNYSCSGDTPLNDRVFETLSAVLAKQVQVNQTGAQVRTATLIVSDGANNASRRSAAEVKKLVTDLLKAECHIVAAMGIDDGSTDFRQVFSEMGIPDQWILTPKNNPTEIRRAFNLFSRSSVQASQGAASFSKTNAGGFQTP